MMILLDKPYVSDYLQKTIAELAIPVIQTPALQEFDVRKDLTLISENEAISRLRQNPGSLLYSNSENAIQWISKNLQFCDLPEKINLFKDKVRFRELTRSLYPEYYFKAIDFDHLESMDEITLSYPLILKPAVGFFSMGVYKLNKPGDFKKVQKQMQTEMHQFEKIYPAEVFHPGKFILEACIKGREFAIDAYYDQNGEPVILNIMEHYFSSESDVSDRLYSTSAVLIRRFINRFQDLLVSIGELAELKNFPVHVEVRITEAGEIIPIEVNPLRFGGWCTTADLAGLAFGFNPYRMFYKQERPDWDRVLRDKENVSYSILILDNSTGADGSQILQFDYDKLLAEFSEVLEFRKVDYRQYPIFGFLFLKTNAEESEPVEKILKSDLSEYITINS